MLRVAEMKDQATELSTQLSAKQLEVRHLDAALEMHGSEIRREVKVSEMERKFREEFKRNQERWRQNWEQLEAEHRRMHVPLSSDG